MSLGEVGTVVLGVLGGGGVWTVIAEVGKARARRRDEASAAAIAAPAQISHAQAGLAEALTAQMRETLEENAKDRRQLRQERARDKREMKAMRGEMAGLRIAVGQCEDHRDECRGELAEVRAQVAKMMAENPPAGPYDTISRPATDRGTA